MLLKTPNKTLIKYTLVQFKYEIFLKRLRYRQDRPQFLALGWKDLETL